MASDKDSATANAVAALVQALSPEFIERFVRYLTSRQTLNEITPGRILREISNEDAKSQFWAFIELVKQRNPQMTPQTLALGIECALQTCRAKDLAQSIDLVWTGPDVPAPMRRSAAVLLELISGARKDLVIVSFAAFRIADALDALESAAQRGVSIRFILESEDESDGRYRQYGGSPFSSLAGHSNVKLFVWPNEKRPPGALLHAKAIVADASAALITSANLTENAISSNIEVGVLVKGGDAPKRLHEHVMRLIHAKEFTEVAYEVTS